MSDPTSTPADMFTPKPLLDPEVAAALQAKYPGEELRAVKTVGGPVVLKTPTPPQVFRWQADLERNKDPASKSAIHSRLVIECCVYPETAVVSGYLAKYAVLPSLLAARLLDYASGMIEDEEQKL